MDEYGVFEFSTSTGEVISGIQKFIEGDTINVTYTLKNTDYKFSGIGNSQSKSKSIKVTSELDGKTLTRDTFKIKIIKK